MPPDPRASEPSGGGAGRSGLWGRWWPWLGELRAPATWRADALAALLGATLVLPQAIAFAALAGLPPAMGLAASVLPTVVAALAGSSRHVMTGPTNATSLALGAMLLPLAHGQPALALGLALLLTLGVGLLQSGLALARLGHLANFISPAVLLGFTTGAAALIAWYAVAGMMGAAGRSSPWDAWAAAAGHAAVLWPPLAVGGLTVVVALGLRRAWPRGPHMLLALVAATGFSLLAPLPPDSLHRAGQIGSAWPEFVLPWAAGAGVAVPVNGPAPGLAWAGGAGLLAQLLPMALALAIVALGQAMAIAKLLAQRTGHPLDANRECLGQGLANIGAAFTGGMVVCGSLNRSLPNLEAGARTPMAGVLAGLLLPVLVAVAAPGLAQIPLAAVSGLLLLVAWGLWDRAAWGRVWRMGRREFGIALVTAACTLVLRLEMAVLTGVMLSLVVYLARTARPALRTMGFDRHDPQRRFVVLGDTPGQRPPGALPECPQLKLLRMEGDVWFGAVPHVADHLRALRERPHGPRHLLVMAKSMNFIDLAAADLWDDERIRRRERGGDLWFHRPRPQVLSLWQRSGFLQRLGEDHVFPDKRRAIATIVPLLDDGICRACQARVFEECERRPGAPLSPTI